MFFYKIVLYFYSKTGAIATTGGVFRDETVPVVVGRVECAGNESHILECSHLTASEVALDCDPSEVAGVICQGYCLYFWKG